MITGFSRRIRAFVAASSVAMLAHAAEAQAPATRLDSLFSRAQQLVSEGNGAAGRALVDSVLGASSEGSAQFAEALYWRAVLAESGASAQHDYLRLAIEYPSSDRAPDALLRLAQLELARGDREAGVRHLERLSRDYPTSRVAPRADYWRARTLMDSNLPSAMGAACAAIARARASAPAEDVELRNQIDFHARRCDGAGGVAATASDSTGRPASTRPAPPKAPADAAEGRFSVQVAAYARQPDAEALAARLRRRSLGARVVSASDMHRVWIGKYQTRTEANAAMQELKRSGIAGFVVERK
jgi:cell division septation protein DedD